MSDDSLEARVERIEDELGIESDKSDDEPWVMVEDGSETVVAFDPASAVVEMNVSGVFTVYADEYSSEHSDKPPRDSPPSNPGEYAWSACRMWTYDGGDE